MRRFGSRRFIRVRIQKDSLKHGSNLNNDELDVHTGLLEGLDHDLDRTDSRLTGARRRLDRVAKGAKENGMCDSIVLVFGCGSSEGD